MAIINSTDENFEKLKSENKIFLAKMTASWCQPCKMLNPVLEEISEEMKDQLVIANHILPLNLTSQQNFQFEVYLHYYYLKMVNLKQQKLVQV